MTDFEKFIQAQKSKLDLDQVDPKIWERMEQDLPRPKPKLLRLIRPLVAVAAVFLFGLLAYQQFFTKPKNQIPLELIAAYGFENPQIAQLIRNKIEQIRTTPLPAKYLGDMQLLLDQAAYLDEHYKSRKESLASDNFNEHEAIELLEYYKAKSELLDKIILEIEKINKNEKEFNIQSKKANLNI